MNQVEVTELVQRIMNCVELTPELINEARKVASGMEDYSRIEYAVINRIKEMDPFLKAGLIKVIKDNLFAFDTPYREISDIRIIFGDLFIFDDEGTHTEEINHHKIENLITPEFDEQAWIDAEGYKTINDPDAFTPYYSVQYKNLYKSIRMNINKILKQYDINQRIDYDKEYFYQIEETGVNIFLDKAMLDLLESPDEIKMIVINKQGETRVFEINSKNKNWKAMETELSNSPMCLRHMKEKSVFKKTKEIEELKESILKAHTLRSSRKKPPTRQSLIIEKYRKSEFDTKSFINAYGELYNPYELSEPEELELNKKRLMYITTEKFVQKGIPYEIAKKYSEGMFTTIEEYKRQIETGIVTTGEFPKKTLLKTVDEIKKPKQEKITSIN